MGVFQINITDKILDSTLDWRLIYSSLLLLILCLLCNWLLEMTGGSTMELTQQEMLSMLQVRLVILDVEF